MTEEQPKVQDGSWLVDMVIQFTNSPAWNEQVSTFIRDKCILFDNFDEENKHEYVQIHNEFKSLVDNLLAAHLLEVDILPEDFEQQCVEAGLETDPRMQTVAKQLAAADDFLKFKEMMLEHHMLMQKEVEATLQELSAVQAATAASISETAAPAPSPEATPSSVAAGTATAAQPSGSAPSAPSVQEERAFGAGGGFYGRAALTTGSKKPASTDKAAAIRKALCSAVKPK